ncbi:MAG: leucine-rich repeat domain-containing protein [Clostridia bacterium]|nr:leucine-rich repeat domain-containing protein [Clostridia bacterium]
MGFSNNLLSDFDIQYGELVKYKGKGGNVLIPNSVKSIGEDAFNGCESLTSIIIPNSVESIGALAFYKCTSLKSIKIGNSVKRILGCAFAGCTSLTSITIPNSVKYIGELAFAKCTSLQSIIIGDSVESIGEDAFYGCWNLKTVYNLSKLDIVKDSDTHGFVALHATNVYTDFDIQNGVLVKYKGKGGNVVIPNTVKSIGWWAFSKCTSLQSITIGDSVESIGDWAFYGCENLKTVYNLSKLNIVKGSDTHGEVAKYATNVYTELPSDN